MVVCLNLEHMTSSLTNKDIIIFNKMIEKFNFPIYLVYVFRKYQSSRYKFVLYVIM